MEKPEMTLALGPGSKSFAVTMVMLWLLAISATIAETDIYRYASLWLVALAVIYLRRDFHCLRHDWMAWACTLWGAYALGRFFYGLAVYGERGASEWLYVFPLFFPAMGVALHAAKRQIPLITAAFFTLSCLALLAFTPYAEILGGERITPLFHKNSIHGAVGCGLILIGAFYWIMHAWENDRVCNRQGYAILFTGLLTSALCLFNIFGSKSKGVWLALAVAVVVMGISLLFYARIRRIWPAIAACIIILCVGLFTARDNIDEFAGPTFNSAVELSEMATAAGGIPAAIHQAIGMPDTPGAMRERLELWSNALEVISASPLFGSGNHWLALWGNTTYADLPYTIIHNGYLELVIRHGLAGLLAVTILVLAACTRMISAYRQGAIGTSFLACYMVMLIFFCMTLFSNSNNRLAIGESWLTVMAAVMFAVAISMRKDSEKPAPALPR